MKLFLIISAFIVLLQNYVFYNDIHTEKMIWFIRANMIWVNTAIYINKKSSQSQFALDLTFCEGGYIRFCIPTQNLNIILFLFKFASTTEQSLYYSCWWLRFRIQIFYLIYGCKPRAPPPSVREKEKINC